MIIEFMWDCNGCGIKIKRLCNVIGIDYMGEKSRIRKNPLMKKKVTAFYRIINNKRLYNIYYPLSDFDNYIFGLIKIYPEKENILIAYYDEVVDRYNKNYYTDKRFEEKLLKDSCNLRK